ncbi:MAG: folate-binding protein YgfZ [Polyangiaceae bacterium]|nr:folate-binding protein YgfZ [Polyangiaceae bacterium]
MSDIEADLDAVQNGALLRALPLRTLIVRGPDRQAWLNGLVTCELAKARPGDAMYGLVVAKNGKIQSEIYVLLGEEDMVVGLRTEKAAEITETLDRHLVMEDVELELQEEGPRWFAAFGPNAGKAVEAARARGERAGVVRRAGLDVAFITPAAQPTVDAVLQAAAPARVASDDGWTRVRVEHGIAEHGVDFDDSNYPQEPALERDAVSFNKGCYLGQEAVFMLEKRGHVKKRLVQLLVDGPIAMGDTITTNDGTEIGKVTSVALRDWKNLALGYVKYKHAKADVELKAGASPATVTALLAIKAEEES